MPDAAHEPGQAKARAGWRIPQTHRLPSRRPGVAPLAKIGMAVFFVGLIAICVILILFASGARDLALWLNLVALLAPLGLAIGFVGVFVEVRRGVRASKQGLQPPPPDQPDQPRTPAARGRRGQSRRPEPTG